MNNIYSVGSFLYLFSRDKEGKLEINQVSSFEPYFYVGDEKGKHTSIYGEKARKIVCEEPFDVYNQRQRYGKTFEADIHYPNRYIIDEIEDFGDDPIRKHFIDIELFSESGILDVQHARDPVIGICVYDNFKDIYHQFLWHEEIRSVDELDYSRIVSAVGGNIVIHIAETEAKMFQDWMVWERENSADVWWGWYASKFDYPYLFNRVGEEYIKFLSPIEIGRKDKYGCFIAGVYLGDLLEHYKKLTHFLFGQRESYSLDYISRVELGEGKSEVLSPDMIADKWKNDLESFIIYNTTDVQIEKGIEEKYKITEYINSLRKSSHSMFEDTLQYAKMIDCFMLYFAKKKLKIILPTKKPVGKEKKRGPYVGKPEKGLYENIIVLDLSFLYPSIIRSLNISPEMKDENGEIEVNGKRFKKKPLGFFPKVVKYFQDERIEMKRKMFEVGKDSDEFEEFDMKQRALKGLNNAVIGCFGYWNSRFYDKDIFEVVTYMAREIQKRTEEFIEKNKLGKVIYQDCDSLFLRVGETKNNIIEKGEEIQRKINQHLDEIVEPLGIDEHFFEYKFEKLYARILFGETKKRYCGLLVWREGEKMEELDIVGFETIRSDAPRAIRKFQKKLFKLVLEGLGKEEIDEYVIKFWEEYEKLPLDIIAFPVGFNKPLDKYKNLPIHIRAIKNAMKLGKSFTVGEKFKWAYIFPNKDFRYEVMAFNEMHYSHMKNFEIDYVQMKKRLKKVIEFVYGILDWEMPSVIPIKEKDKKMLTLF